MVRLHERYPVVGLDGLYHSLKRNFICSGGRIHRLMKAHNIHSQRKRAYKATANSKHSYPVAPNLLKRSFAADRPILFSGRTPTKNPLKIQGVFHSFME